MVKMYVDTCVLERDRETWRGRKEGMTIKFLGYNVLVPSTPLAETVTKNEMRTAYYRKKSE